VTVTGVLVAVQLGFVALVIFKEYVVVVVGLAVVVQALAFARPVAGVHTHVTGAPPLSEPDSVVDPPVQMDPDEAVATAVN